MEIDPALARLILEHIDTVAVCDAEGRYIYVNKGWVEWMGLQPEEVLGKYVREVVPDTRIDVALKTKRSLVGQILYGRHKARNGKTNVVTYYPIFKDGEVIACFAFSIFKDIEGALGFKQRLGNLTDEVNYLKNELRKLRGARYTVDSIIGDSQPMRKLREQIYQAARTNSTVLIDGETGTGKELVAHAIHGVSQRSAGSFIKINCAAIPGDLLEAELFGYEEGSFTGAVKGGRTGKFEMAHMGSLFLDEVDQLPLSLQPKLLRVLQEREVDRLGGKGSVEVNVRLIAATNVSLSRLVEDKNFRNDLYYRLNVMQITVPPLRERKEDLPQLVDALRDRLNHQLGVEVKSVAPDVLRLLAAYDWPGNVRELQNVLERAMNAAWGEVLEYKHLEWFVERQRPGGAVALPGSADSLRAIKRAVEREAIAEALKNLNDNKALAAKQLQISRTMLYKKLRQFGMDVNKSSQ
jgi:PAS domain S-box-containing protein